jgi:hypothetical protein
MKASPSPQTGNPAPLDYPAAEDRLAQMVRAHQMDWSKVFREHSEWRAGNASREDFVEDGFYPGYLAAKIRILFIGREARSLGGCNYLEHLWDSYRRTKQIGGRSLASNKFHTVMLRLAYGFLHGFPQWSNLPSVYDICGSMGQPEGVAFAFMNLSKLSNERGDSAKADWGQIAFATRISTSSRNWIAEEIALLRPHVVIAANLHRYLATLGKLTPREGVEGLVDAYELNSHGHESVLLNTLHFSARKNAELTFYRPVRQWWENVRLQ